MLVLGACTDTELCHILPAARSHWMLQGAQPCQPILCYTQWQICLVAASLISATLSLDFLCAVKWKHQSLKPLSNQSAVWICTSVAVQLEATVAVNHSLCQCRVTPRLALLIGLCSVLIASAVFDLFLQCVLDSERMEQRIQLSDL